MLLECDLTVKSNGSLSVKTVAIFIKIVLGIPMAVLGKGSVINCKTVTIRKTACLYNKQRQLL
ncbi:hypothetical protein NV36_08710 [Dokdonia donghaensis DSW-1]|uniref:Uncharacterized protein n=1 Tax=Dokdonia donghaensis DSW-1 TaxID=1300343 RepID=A0A0A2GX80_9FLAO|nr:hypothetical protein NV36_08710 [Dokdonia donghaensis DSW-1]